jgi:hypothetical protein
LLRQEAGAELPFKARRWFSTYRIHHRSAARFRHRRAFLLGDAAQRAAFRVVSQIGIHYRNGLLSQTLDGLPDDAPRAGDRFPWLRLKLQSGGRDLPATRRHALPPDCDRSGPPLQQRPLSAIFCASTTSRRTPSMTQNSPAQRFPNHPSISWAPTVTSDFAGSMSTVPPSSATRPSACTSHAVPAGVTRVAAALQPPLKSTRAAAGAGCPCAALV